MVTTKSSVRFPWVWITLGECGMPTMPPRPHIKRWLCCGEVHDQYGSGADETISVMFSKPSLLTTAQSLRSSPKLNSGAQRFVLNICIRHGSTQLMSATMGCCELTAGCSTTADQKNFLGYSWTESTPPKFIPPWCPT